MELTTLTFVKMEQIHNCGPHRGKEGENGSCPVDMGVSEEVKAVKSRQR